MEFLEQKKKSLKKPISVNSDAPKIYKIGRTTNTTTSKPQTVKPVEEKPVEDTAGNGDDIFNLPF